jgi:hypothetical protein
MLITLQTNLSLFYRNHSGHARSKSQIYMYVLEEPTFYPLLDFTLVYIQNV